MKERLIGDEQLLVTADTSLGDALWDWVAADASRRAADGWRIAQRVEEKSWTHNMDRAFGGQD